MAHTAMLPGEADHVLAFRQIQLLVDAGALRPMEGTGQGKGNHAAFDSVEARLAIVARWLTSMGFGIGDVAEATVTLRNHHNRHPVGGSALDRGVAALHSSWGADDPVTVALAWYPDIRTFRVEEGDAGPALRRSTPMRILIDLRDLFALAKDALPWPVEPDPSRPPRRRRRKGPGEASGGSGGGA